MFCWSKNQYHRKYTGKINLKFFSHEDRNKLYYFLLSCALQQYVLSFPAFTELRNQKVLGRTYATTFLQMFQSTWGG
jgi:hypothetical protein